MFADFSLKTLPFITPTTFYLKDKKKKENNNYKDIDLYLQLNRIVLAQPRKKQKSPTKILLLWQVKLENAFNLLLSRGIVCFQNKFFLQRWPSVWKNRKFCFYLKCYTLFRRNMAGFSSCSTQGNFLYTKQYYHSVRHYCGKENLAG